MSITRAAIGIGAGALLVGGGMLAASRRAPDDQTAAEQGAQVFMTPEQLQHLTQDSPKGVVQFLEAGLALDVQEGLTPRLVEAGVNRFVRVLQARDQKAILVCNSGPAYPWMDPAGLREIAQGTWDEWHAGPVKLPELGIEFAWPGQWAWEEGPARRLALVAFGRIILVTAPDWSAPAARATVNSLQALEGGGYRDVYVRIGRAPKDAAGGVVPAALTEDLDKALRLVEEGFPELPATVRQGAAAWRGKKLDHLDAMILLDLLRPFLGQLERLAMQKAMENSQQVCPVRDPNEGPTEPAQEAPPGPR